MDKENGTINVTLISVCLECGKEFSPLSQCCKAPNIRFMEREVKKQMDEWAAVMADIYDLQKFLEKSLVKP